MTSGSYRKSFLDELLYADDIEKLELPKRSKSVRFIDNDKNQASKSSASGELGEKFKSINDEDKSSQKSNWLGLSEDGFDKNSIKWTKSIKIGDQEDRFNQARNENGEINYDLEKETTEQMPVKEVSWLNIKRKIQDTKKSEPDLDLNSQAALIKESVKSDLKAKINSNLETMSDSVSSQALMLQAKINILEMEKASFTKTIEQLESNHKAEIDTLKTISDKQISMMTEAYKRQEKMLLEEKEAYHQEWKHKLEASEKDKESLRAKYAEKVSWVEKDCQFEIEKIREMNKKMLKHLSEGYEQELERVKKLKNSEIEAIRSLSGHNMAIEGLIQKWQENAHKLEKLYSHLSFSPEGDTLDDHSQREEHGFSFSLIEKDWKVLKHDMDREKVNYQYEREKLSKLMNELKEIVHTEQKGMSQERDSLINERKVLEEERDKSESEIRRKRETLEKESKEVKEKLMLLEKNSLELESKQKLFATKETDFNHEMIKQKDEINQMALEISFEKSRLENEKIKLKSVYSNLEIEQKRLESKKLLFDTEKDKLRQLANRLQERAQELESLLQMVYQKREDGLKIIQSSETIRSELRQREEAIDQKAKEVNKEEMRLMTEKQQILLDMKSLQEQRSSLICNLCGNGLNRIKFSSKDFPPYPPLSQNNAYSSLEENDRALLIWQITSQQDAALLAEETAFINSINQYKWSDGIKKETNQIK